MRFRPLPLGAAIAGLALTLGSAVPAGAVPTGFNCITDTTPANCAIGEAQISLNVTDPGSSRIAFTFSNAGPTASSITQIYWDDGTLASIFSITNTPGSVEFASPAVPPNLPGFNLASPPFETSFSVDSNPPVPQLGVNPGETLTVIFNLAGGQDFADAIQALTNGSLRVGIHVQGIGATSGSESFVNNPIPEPGTLALLGAGLLALGVRGRRRCI